MASLGARSAPFSVELQLEESQQASPVNSTRLFLQQKLAPSSPADSEQNQNFLNECLR